MLTVVVVAHARKDRSEELEAFLGLSNIMIPSQIQSTDIVISLSGYPDSQGSMPSVIPERLVLLSRAERSGSPKVESNPESIGRGLLHRRIYHLQMNELLTACNAAVL
jgi:hypothetical protein